MPENDNDNTTLEQPQEIRLDLTMEAQQIDKNETEICSPSQQYQSSNVKKSANNEFDGRHDDSSILCSKDEGRILNNEKCRNSYVSKDGGDYNLTGIGGETNIDKYLSKSQESRGDNRSIEYGFLVQNTALASVFILDNVLLPLLRKENNLYGQEKDPYNLRSSLHLTYAKKFTSRVCRYIEQEKIGANFILPEDMNFRENVEEIVDDSILTLNITNAGNDWLKNISNILEYEILQSPIGFGPIGEIDFWRRRHVVLSDLNEKIGAPKIQKAIELIRKINNSLYLKLDEKINAMTKLRIEAEDNAKFLSTLERHIRTLNHGSLVAMFDILPSLVDGMRMIWSISRHYNRDERMVPLMQRVAWQLAFRVKESIVIKQILSGDISEAKSIAQEAKQLLEAWRQTYMDIRAHIEETGPGRRRWEFDRELIFEETDHIAFICTQLIEVITTIEQFQRFLQPELSAVTGESSTVDLITEQVHSIKSLIDNIDFDPFQISNGQKWESLMNIFRRKVSDTEICAGTSIEKAFQQLRSSEAAFDLVLNFRNIQSRPFIHRRIDERYYDILDQYSKELGQVEKVFNSRKNNPPVPIFSNKISGSIAWAEITYIRIKEPIVRFHSHEGLLSSGYGNVVKQRYLSLARSIDSHKDKLLREWYIQVNSASRDCLRQSILVRADDDESVSPSTSSLRSTSETQSIRQIQSPKLKESKFSLENMTIIQNNRGIKGRKLSHLNSNFPDDVFMIIEESICLQQMGFKIPETALHLCSQEDNYHRYDS